MCHVHLKKEKIAHIDAAGAFNLDEAGEVNAQQREQGGSQPA